MAPLRAQLIANNIWFIDECEKVQEMSNNIGFDMLIKKNIQKSKPNLETERLEEREYRDKRVLGVIKPRRCMTSVYDHKVDRPQEGVQGLGFGVNMEVDLETENRRSQGHEAREGIEKASLSRMKDDQEECLEGEKEGSEGNDSFFGDKLERIEDMDEKNNDEDELEELSEHLANNNVIQGPKIEPLKKELRNNHQIRPFSELRLNSYPPSGLQQLEINSRIRLNRGELHQGDVSNDIQMYKICKEFFRKIVK